jgi:hypothetical protein
MGSPRGSQPSQRSPSRSLAGRTGRRKSSRDRWRLPPQRAGFSPTTSNPPVRSGAIAGALGFSFAGLALTIPSNGMGRGVAALVLIPAAVLAVPILDTTLVTVKRLFVRRSITEGGRNHASNRLVALVRRSEDPRRSGSLRGTFGIPNPHIVSALSKIRRPASPRLNQVRSTYGMMSYNAALLYNGAERSRSGACRGFVDHLLVS